jgi:hypothetical protein
MKRHFKRNENWEGLKNFSSDLNGFDSTFFFLRLKTALGRIILKPCAGM